MAKIIKLIISIFVCQLAGIVGSFFTFTAISSWYSYLEKPFFTPPNWVFGPVWITLYTLMGISLYIVWQSNKSKEKNKALFIFFIQLLLNSLWSILFFGFNLLLLSFFEILLLLFFIFLTIFYFYKISKISAYLLIPYFLWVNYATLLNLYLYILNR